MPEQNFSFHALYCIVLALASPYFSYSSTILVPDQYPTIQAGITAAADGDTVLVAPGTYTGEGNRNIELQGKAIAVISEGGAEVTTIDVGGRATSGFFIHEYEGNATIIKGFRIVNSTGEGYYARGSMHIVQSSPIIQDCILENNSRGLTIEYSKAIIENCTIRNNGPLGGVLTGYQASDALIKNCLIVANHADDSGGGIKVDSYSPLIQNCTIADNSAHRGGGINVSYVGKLRMSNAIVWANEADTDPEISVDTALAEVSFSNIRGGLAGEGNIDEDPCFVGRLLGDYHLNPVSSSIDAGDPNDEYSREPYPDGGRINIGRYGNTPEATSFAAKLVIKDFSYEPGCESPKMASLKGRNFGNEMGDSHIWLGNTEVTAISLWTDTLIQFSAAVDAINNHSILLVNGIGERDTIPASQQYPPFAKLVEGEISGLWSADCPGTYLLTGPVVVPEGKKLTIEPGVQVLVDRKKAGNNVTFTVEGTLVADGTADRPIRFAVLPYQAFRGSWQGMRLDMQNASENAYLDHCVIEDARCGIIVSGSGAIVDHCTIRNNSYDGIWWKARLQVVEGKIENSQVTDNGGIGIRIEALGGDAEASPMIHRNILENNGRGGIAISARLSTPFYGLPFKSSHANPSLSNNIIRNNSGLGISCSAEGDWASASPSDFRYRAFAHPVVEGNLIIGNRGGFLTISRPSGGDTWYSYSEPTLINNTITDNGPAEVTAGDSTTITLVNSIVMGSEVAVEQYGGGSVIASYSTILPSFSGEAMIDQPPLFFNEAAGDFRLFTQSPQIDAGNNGAVSVAKDLSGANRILDSDQNGAATVDIGAYEYEPPRLLSQSPDLEACTGAALLLAVETSGSNLTYQWQKEGEPLPGANNSELEILQAETADEGIYTCVVRDELNGQIVSGPITVTVQPLLAVSVDVEVSDTEICRGEQIQFSAIAINGGEDPAFTWRLNGEVVHRQADWSFDRFEDGDEVSCTLESSATCVENSVAIVSRTIQVNELPTPAISGDLDICEGETTTLLAAGGQTYLWSNGSNTPSLETNAAGEYAVSVTDANGCTNTTAVTVQVTELPTPAISGDLDICEGETTTLLATGGQTYLWSNGSNTPSLETNAAGEYAVSVTDANGCTNTTAVTVRVTALPVVELLLERDTFCVDEPSTALTGGTPPGGIYSGSGIVDGSMFSPSAAGVGNHTLTYTVTDEQGCKNSVDQAVVVEETGLCVTGLQRLDARSFNIYPNPSDGNINIVLSDAWSGIIDLEIWDGQGRKIRFQRSHTRAIRVHHLPRGFYVLRLSDETFYAMRKLIVQ